ncbi:MAG: homoserine O-succinyltransferase [Tissierellia bacterium]|nr:homoserine O-succinyltransferase [Tissierellia bacterium]
MPLIIPKDLIGEDILKRERIFTMMETEAHHQDIRPIKIGIVNLMPKKEETELQILRMLSNSALQINIDLIHMQSYSSSNTDQRHLDRFYKVYDDIKDEKYDALIITGAPVEKMEYERIIYWKELKKIFDFANKNVYSTMFICWSAQAALHYFYDIPNNVLEEKLFGVFKYEKQTDHKLLKGFDDEFYIPQSRYTSVSEEKVLQYEDLEVLAAREDTGVSIAASKDSRFIFSFGHWEYDKDTLHQEYLRDIGKKLKIKPPSNYYREDNPNKPIKVTWRSAGNLFFTNWLNYCVYQETPYELDEIQKKNVSKFGGSSLSDAGQFKKVKDIILSKDDRDVIVVSAPGKRHLNDTKVTDDLIHVSETKENIKELEGIVQRLQNELDFYKDDLNSVLDSIQCRFLNIVNDLDLDVEAKSHIYQVFDNIHSMNSKDEIISRGEYLNGYLLAKYLNYSFVDSKNLILFDEKGEVDIHGSIQRIQDQLKGKNKVVVPGFYGEDKNGNIKTLERGGSDLTGSLIARALHSNVYENWTDVNGVMTGDPKVDERAKTISKLNYDELKEIVEEGADIYYPDAIAPLKEKNIMIRILNTNDPESQGTEIKD